MWGSVLAVGLMGNLNPVRLGVILLLVSRPRHTQNLIAFWVGCLMATFFSLAIPLFVLRFTPVLHSAVRDIGNPAMSPTVGKFQIGFGIFALLVAALMTTRLRRRSTNPPKAGADKSAFVANMQQIITQEPDSAPDAASKVKVAIQRLVKPARKAWDNGSPWIAYVIGLAMGPAPDMILVVLAIIVTSGAATGAQLSAVMAYAFVLLALVETVLVSSLIRPAKTEAVLQRLRDWTLTHRQLILITIFTVVGVSVVFTGISRI